MAGHVLNSRSHLRRRVVAPLRVFSQHTIGLLIRKTGANERLAHGGRRDVNVGNLAAQRLRKLREDLITVAVKSGEFETLPPLSAA